MAVGWEYHTRPRDQQGRWVAKHDRQLVSMHFQFRREVYDDLRRHANEAKMNMTDYVEHVLQQQWTRDRTRLMF